MNELNDIGFPGSTRSITTFTAPLCESVTTVPETFIRFTRPLVVEASISPWTPSAEMLPLVDFSRSDVFTGTVITRSADGAPCIRTVTTLSSSSTFNPPGGTSIRRRPS